MNEPCQNVAEQEQVWERGWDGHERAQLRRMAKLPMWDKLQWLEEAHFMVLCLQGKSLELTMADEPD